MTTISVFNSYNQQVWQKNLTDSEVKQVKGISKNSPQIPILPALVYPVRTNNLKNFSKDFFLPTTVNYAMKVDGIVGKIFAILGTLILDLATFPLRLIFAIPRVIQNARAPEHPLITYLKNEGVTDPSILSADQLRLSTVQVKNDSKTYEIASINLVAIPSIEYNAEYSHCLARF